MVTGCPTVAAAPSGCAEPHVPAIRPGLILAVVGRLSPPPDEMTDTVKTRNGGMRQSIMIATSLFWRVGRHECYDASRI